MVVMLLKVVEWKIFTLIIEDTVAHDFNACVLQIV